MGHVLKINPVFKEMIWGGHKLRDVYGYDIPSDNTGVGQSQLTKMEIALLVMENLLERHYLVYGMNIESYLLILKVTNFHYW